ncbi:hypothetical protein T492DRAFT_908424 [Pavlovales sp. CCMP2436]|nr:hypothetical protein T492DRAFT_908424 [Pavlovales sp. CCMP2436]
MYARVVLAAALCATAAAHQAPRQLAGVRALRSRVAASRQPPSRLQMAGSRVNVVKELIVPVPASHLYALLANYSRYKEIWPGDYQSVNVLARQKGGERGKKDRTTVEFKHTPIMGIGMDYTLDVESVPGKTVLWDLNSSSALAFNHGGWNLTDLGDGSTRVTYGCVVQLKQWMPTFVTSVVLDQAFPKMLKTFSTSAIRDWAQVQAQTRARFERPLQEAAGGFVNVTIKSVEATAQLMGNVTKAIVSVRAQDFSSTVDQQLKNVAGGLAMLRKLSNGPEATGPGEEVVVDQLLSNLEGVAANLKSMANATVADLDTKIDLAVAALDAYVDLCDTYADTLARSTASQLADMSTGRYGRVNISSIPSAELHDTTDVTAVAAAKPAPAIQRVIAGGLANLAGGSLNVLEAIWPGKRPPTNDDQSKRERLGILFGRNWTPGAKARSGGKSTAETPAESKAGEVNAGARGDDEAEQRKSP